MLYDVTQQKFVNMSNYDDLKKVILGGIAYYYNERTGKIFNDAEGLSEAPARLFTDDEITEIKQRAAKA